MLNGDLSFAGLESWASGAGPYAPATGSLWGTGALDYSVSVRGNSFISTGGDDGEVTGAFFSAASLWVPRRRGLGSTGTA